MKHSYFKNLRISLSLCFVLLCTALIINSCKKDNSSKAKSTVYDPDVNQAKLWYESTYPANTIGKLSIQDIKSTNNGVYDYSQHIKPDWNHSAAYTRLNSNVIEIPIDPSVHLGSALKNQTANKEVYPKENSRSSFLLLNDGKNYTAYIMTIIADSSYLKNDPGKLACNTYRQREIN